MDDDRADRDMPECSGCTYYSHYSYEDPCNKCTRITGFKKDKDLYTS